VVGIYQRKFAFQQGREPGLAALDTSRAIVIQDAGTGPPTDEEVLNDWMVSLIKTMRADMDNAKLYPPGMVYIMVSPSTMRRVRIRTRRCLAGQER
jgi:hypothetical protein